MTARQLGERLWPCFRQKPPNRVVQHLFRTGIDMRLTLLASGYVIPNVLESLIQLGRHIRVDLDDGGL